MLIANGYNASIFQIATERTIHISLLTFGTNKNVRVELKIKENIFYYSAVTQRKLKFYPSVFSNMST